MRLSTILGLAFAQLRGQGDTSPAVEWVTRATYRYDRLRSIPAGMLESAGSTFLLLIAVQAYQAGATEKALIAAGGNIGMLLTPIVVQGVERFGWRMSKSAVIIALLGSVFFFLPAIILVVAGIIAQLSALERREGVEERHDPGRRQEHELAEPLAPLGRDDVPGVPRVERLGRVDREHHEHPGDAEPLHVGPPPGEAGGSAGSREGAPHGLTSTGTGGAPRRT